MMEQQGDKRGANLLKADLSANDLSLLDSSYQTANEEENNQADCLQTVDHSARRIEEMTRRIKSQRLVDSNNEESTDAEDDSARQCAELRDKLTNCSPESTSKYDLEQNKFSRTLSVEASGEQSRVNRRRSTWRQQSLMNRLQATRTLDGDGAARQSSAAGYNGANGEASGGCFASNQPAGDCSGAALCDNDNSSSLIGGSLNCSPEVSESFLAKQQNDSESIMIRVEQYNSLSNEHKSIELVENDAGVVQSIKQQNSTLNNLMSFHQKKSLIGNDKTGVPSRSSSAIDLSGALNGDQHDNSVAMMSKLVSGSTVVDYEGHSIELFKDDNNNRSTKSQSIRFTRALSPHSGCGGGGGGSLSDYSSQIQSIGRILDTNAVSRRQIESRVKNWKKSNKIITNIHENPFNMHLDLLEKFEQHVCDARGENKNYNVNSDSKPELQKSVETEAVSKLVQKEVVSADQRQPKQDQLNDCALHLTHLYRRNQTVMDNNSEFRALLYNIICCLLVQDEQVLATQSVGKMLDVIRAHLESVTRGYSTTQSSTTVDRSSCLAVTGGARGSSTKVYKSSDERRGSLARSTGSQSDRSNQLENISETSRQENRKTGKVFNDALSPTSYHRSQKPIDFRRISSVSFNDEQLINDLCDNRRAELSQRSGSLSLEKSPDGRDSPWAYQELLSERRRPRLDSSSTTSAGCSQQQLMNTSQSSLDQANDSNRRQQLGENTNDSGNGTTCDYQTTTTSSSSEKQPALSSSSSQQSIKNSDYNEHSYHGGPRFSATPGDLLRCRSMRFDTEFKPKQQPSYISTDEYLTNNDHWTSTTLGAENTDGDVDEFTSSVGTSTIATGGGPSNDEFAQHGDGNDVASRRAELEWTLNKLINLELKHTWLTSNDTLKRAIRKIGVPNEIRGKVWLILVEQLIGNKYDAKEFLAQASKTITRELEASEPEASRTDGNEDEELQSILKQIELDINRTMPGHRLFEDGAEGGIKLRRILVAYSVHINREIAYCQGFNFIVALLLSLFDGDEEKALRGFVCIVDHIFPSKYYFDHYLTGARADQFLLADFICDQLIKNPTMAERKMVEGVTSSITLNWFISLFHGAVPTLTRLTILDHFMLEGVKALFRFTMAILYLAFQVAPPSSCEVFTAIRNTAKDLYDIKLLLSIVDQIKLPKDSYFAIRRSFYMVQSSFNSDQFYMQTLSNDAKRNLNPNKPLNVQQLPDTKPPALSLIASASPLNQHHATASSSLVGFNGNHNQPSAATYSNFTIRNSICTDSMNGNSPRVRASANRTKVCIQSLGKLGRSHIKIIDVNVKTNERSLMSPLRNCIVIGISNCGKNLVVARQSSRRSFKSFREQDLTFHIHEICTEIFDGFYLEEANLAIIITHQGEVFKIDTTRCFTDNQEGSTETLMLRDSHSLVEHERVKLRLASLDELTNLLWVYVECEDTSASKKPDSSRIKCPWNIGETANDQQLQTGGSQSSINVGPKPKFRHNNPFLSIVDDDEDASDSNERQLQSNNKSDHQQQTSAARQELRRKIILIDIITFDLFSAFSMNPNFGEITNLRTSLVAFCQLSNHVSSQFSSKIIQIGPTGRYEQLLSFSDVVDYRVSVSESCKQKFSPNKQPPADGGGATREKKYSSQRYSSFRGFLTKSGSLNNNDARASGHPADHSKAGETLAADGSGTLVKYYRSLIKSHSTVSDQTSNTLMSRLRGQENSGDSSSCHLERARPSDSPNKSRQAMRDDALHSMISSGLGDFSGLSETNYIPVNMAFIFRNGKIALFEFTESYAIHTREAQLDRYDYSKVIDVVKDGNVFIVTILTIFDKLIKVVI